MRGCSGEAEVHLVGGVLGPKILTHVKCTVCGFKYNGKSGNDNTTGVIIYSAVVAIFCLGLVAAMFVALAVLTVATR
jgi:hypothetical protein